MKEAKALMEEMRRGLQLAYPGESIQASTWRVSVDKDETWWRRIHACLAVIDRASAMYPPIGEFAAYVRSMTDDLDIYVDILLGVIDDRLPKIMSNRPTHRARIPEGLAEASELLGLPLP